MPHLLIFLITCAVVALCVIIHYEFLFRLMRLMPQANVRHRSRIVFGVIGGLIAHVVEVWVFGLVFFWMNSNVYWGTLQGNYDGSLLASVYFSFTNFTTAGLGDIEPLGAIRFVAATESLAGLVLITWTASFLYLEMTRAWGD